MIEPSRSKRRANDGNQPVTDGLVYCRAVIEITNRCSRNCSYCGMRVGNETLDRYQLAPEAVALAARRAADDGIKILMLQGGDDFHYDLAGLCDAISEVRDSFEDVIVCLGDRPLGDYRRMREAGATQAIIKFETSNPSLYKKFRPHSTLPQRLALVNELASLGYQVSSGFIFGLPGTTERDVHTDLQLIERLPLFAASVSPFIAGDQTPLRGENGPSLDATLQVIADLRQVGPKLLIPSVSALNLLPGGQAGAGQVQGLLYGANELTVNYTPAEKRKGFVIYTTARSVVSLADAQDVVSRANRRLDLRHQAAPSDFLHALASPSAVLPNHGSPWPRLSR